MGPGPCVELYVLLGKTSMGEHVRVYVLGCVCSVCPVEVVGSLSRLDGAEGYTLFASSVQMLTSPAALMTHMLMVERTLRIAFPSGSVRLMLLFLW